MNRERASEGPAPELWLRADEGHITSLVDPRGGPPVVAIDATWSAADTRQYGDALRAELRGFGATLLVLDGADAWRIQPDDPVERLVVERADGSALRAGDVASLLGLALSSGVAPELA